jgi:putative glutamine amidotransferase
LSRPVIGITTQTLDTLPDKHPVCWLTGRCYGQVLASLGAIPWLIPLLPEDEALLRGIYDRLDGVFLPGGNDIDPSHYGEERHPLCDRSDADRDHIEITLARWAWTEGKPLLGVCRGLQLINVALGGTLHQHLADHYPGAIKHDFFSSGTGCSRDYLAHTVQSQSGSYLSDLLGDDDLAVNSMHHQGIKRLAEGLCPTCFSPDGLIEGIEGTKGAYLVGVQWHPEELVQEHARQRRLFADFIAVAGGQSWR